MDPWTISALYEIREAEDRERAARTNRDGWQEPAHSPLATLRERAAATLLGLALRLAPAIEEAHAEGGPVASVPQL